MKTVELYARVRHAVRIEGISERAAAERFGINARTVSKMLKFSVPPGYVRRKPPFRPKLEEFIGIIDAILAADKDRPKKQRHTSKRIFERLRDEHGFTGKITIVKDYVADLRQRSQEMFVPLVHPPGHAQADFGEALGVIGGVERKIHYLAMDLPHSDAIFVVACYFTAAYTRRFANTLSNSTRVFANIGEDNGRGRDAGKDSDGFAVISENSLVTWLPSTLLPYANFFVGFGDPKPLVDGNGAGILKNVGINFETDALTGYPKLDDTGSNAWGGAIGIQYLFNLDQQIVFEVATVQPFEDDGIGASSPQYAFGARYQIPIDRAWLFRADATYQIVEGAEDNFGIRTEVRRKF